MTDRPILFSAPMVRALLDGRKHQTRRVLKHQPPPTGPDGADNGLTCHPQGFRFNDCDYRDGVYQPYPYSVGQRLWVREAWRTESDCYNDLAPSNLSGEETILYEADADWSDNRSTGRSRRGFHMPRWASRLTLAVTSVKVERVTEITPADAIAEGIRPIDCDTPNPRDDFRTLWDSINGKRPGCSWADNPWVVAVTFAVHRHNIDQRRTS